LGLRGAHGIWRNTRTILQRKSLQDDPYCRGQYSLGRKAPPSCPLAVDVEGRGPGATFCKFCADGSFKSGMKIFQDPRQSKRLNTFQDGTKLPSRVSSRRFRTNQTKYPLQKTRRKRSEETTTQTGLLKYEDLKGQCGGRKRGN